MDDFRIGQLTKEMVAAKLKAMADPCAEAAALVRRTVTVALEGYKPGDAGGREKLVEEACQGAMTALLLAEQSLSKGAALILQAVLDIAQEQELDLTLATFAALRGIADMHRFAAPAQMDEIRKELEGRFMGSGEAFAYTLETIKAQSQGQQAQKLRAQA